jgi:hypothetical protein
MLVTFAGPPSPHLAGERRRLHRGSRRAALVVAAAVLALALAVPPLALHGQIAQSVGDFLSDKSQPENAKDMVRDVSNGPLRAFPLIKGSLRPAGSKELPYELSSVRQVVAASTPQGEVRLYELRFSNSYRGSAMIGVATQNVGGATWGADTSCPPGWALRGGGSFVTLPGRTPLFVSGRVSNAVASVDVVYPDGHASRASVANGYFLGWVVPSPGARNGRTDFSPPVTLVARDTTGQAIGHLRVRSDGDIPPSPGQPAQAVACG